MFTKHFTALSLFSALAFFLLLATPAWSGVPMERVTPGKELTNGASFLACFYVKEEPGLLGILLRTILVTAESLLSILSILSILPVVSIVPALLATVVNTLNDCPFTVTTYQPCACSGSLISESEVLTSRFCVQNLLTQTSGNNSQLLGLYPLLFQEQTVYVAVGMSSVSLDSIEGFEDDPTVVVNEVRLTTAAKEGNVEIPDDSTDEDFENGYVEDIAIVYLQDELANISSTATKMAITYSPVTTATTGLSMAGWGAYDCGEDPDKRHVVDATITAATTCNAGPTQGCADYSYTAPPASAVQSTLGFGDMGAPIYEKMGTTFVQVGIVSIEKKNEIFGGGCTTPGDSQLFTPLEKFKDFLNEYKKDDVTVI